ncbi:hypothetical protein HG531_002542 [Fusarium graminearum]|nr:hypothetical protein HG531_002542 [Fusarium graminearum]
MVSIWWILYRLLAQPDLDPLVELLGVNLKVFPVSNNVAKRASHTASILTVRSEDIEKRLRRSFAEELHLLSNYESGILRNFDLIIVAVKLEARGQRHDGKVIV